MHSHMQACGFELISIAHSKEDGTVGHNSVFVVTADNVSQAWGPSFVGMAVLDPTGTICVYIDICAYVYVYAIVCGDSRQCQPIHTCTHVCIHIHTHTYIVPVGSSTPMATKEGPHA